MTDSRAGEARTAKRGKGRPRNSEAAAPSLAAILNLVRTGHATTRQEIERASELGRAAVTDRLTTLGELGLVDESELGEASGGRAPRLTRFNETAGLILVATLDQTSLGVALSDLSGQLLIEHHEELDLTAPAEVTIGRLETLFEWLLERYEPSRPVWGIGISMPGPVQSPPGSGYLTKSPPLLPAWEQVRFVERLIARFAAPVWLRSSVEMMTMGEAKTGEGVNEPNMLLVKVGKRIGAGLVADGQLYRGALGASGLIGQLPVQVNGSSGPLEVLAGSDAIAREGLAAAEAGRSAMLSDLLKRSGAITAIEVSQTAQTGDRAAMEIMSRSGRVIGHTVATLANMLNPSLIVLSGSMAQTNDILLAAVRETVYGESHPLVTRDLGICASRLGNSAGLVGAAAVVVDALFEIGYLRSWILNGAPVAAPEFIELTKRMQLIRGGGSRDHDAPVPPAGDGSSPVAQAGPD